MKQKREVLQSISPNLTWVTSAEVTHMNTITPINPNPALYFQPITPNTKKVSFALQLNPKCKLGRLKFCYKISIFSGELWSKANCLVNLCMYRVYGHKISRGCGVQRLEVDICGNILSEVTKFSVKLSNGWDRLFLLWSQVSVFSCFSSVYCRQ